MAENGFWGNVLEKLADGKPLEPFSHWNDLIQLIGRAIYCRRGLDIAKA